MRTAAEVLGDALREAERGRAMSLELMADARAVLAQNAVRPPSVADPEKRQRVREVILLNSGLPQDYDGPWADAWDLRYVTGRRASDQRGGIPLSREDVLRLRAWYGGEMVPFAEPAGGTEQ